MSQSWQLVFRHDKDGKALKGSKEVLLDAARNGYPVRVGFGSKRQDDSGRSVEHIVAADFISILNGTEVFAQCKTIIGQNPDLDSLKIGFREGFEWTILVGSNGFTDRLNVKSDAQVVNGHRSRQTGISWFALIDESSLTKLGSDPLWDE